MRSEPRGVILDIGGVLHVGDRPLPGALRALARLREARLPLRFLTNTTRRSRRALAAQLGEVGFAVAPEEIHSAPLATRRYLEEHGLRPFLLVHPGVEGEFAGLEREPPNAVVVGDAGEAMTYARMNAALRLLLGGAPLLAMARNRIFQEADGPSLDAGPFVVALEHAAGVTGHVLGKPAADFFRAAVQGLGLPPAEVLMVGDDVESDVIGALGAGLRAALVQTGKYRPGDEHELPAGAVVLPDLGSVVDWILGPE